MSIDLNGGTVTVDSSGNASYSPDDDSNIAKGLYIILVDSDTSNPDMTPSAPVTVTMDATGKITGVASKFAGPKVSFDAKGNLVQTQASTFPSKASDYPTEAVKPTPAGNSAKAKLANQMAEWFATSILPNLTVTIIIQNTTAGDGLQTSQTAGSATTHPTVAKTLTGTVS